MTHYELTNNQRKYFGLVLVADEWDKQALSNTIVVYFNKDKIVKILDYSWDYLEYDTDINTENRQVLIPKTSRGRKQRLTIPKLLKIKGSGIQFSGSFKGGGIHVYDNKRNIFFIKGFAEDGEIKSYGDIDRWISNYIANVPNNYFEWLNEELFANRLNIRVKEGDIIAFKIGFNTYGFARILLDVFAYIKKGQIIKPEVYALHPRSLIVLPYAYYANTKQVDIDTLITKNTLPVLCIFDIDVYRGQMPIIGHKPLSDKDREIPFDKINSTSVTIPYTKTYIDKFIERNN